MSNDVLTLAQHSIRETDSNSLLRMYDQALEILGRSPSQQDRTRADKARQRIATELTKRAVRL